WPSWNPASPVRKRAARTTARASAARLAASATSRATRWLASGAQAHTSAPTRGTNRVAVNSTAAAPGTRGSWPEHQEGDDQHGAPEDTEGVAADQAGLDAPAAAGHVPDHLGHAVDGAVDALLVDGAGQEGGQGPAEVDGEELVDLVDVEPVGQGPPGPGGGAGRGPAPPGPGVAGAKGQPVEGADVQQPGDDRPDRGHPGGHDRQRQRGRR